MDSLTSAAHEESKAHAEMIKQLFPKVSTGNEEQYYRDLRVCHQDVFDRYFLLSIPEGDISQADLDSLLVASTGDRDKLVSRFNELRERGLLAVVLDRLEAYKQKVSLADAVPFIAALFDIGDDLPEGAICKASGGRETVAPRIQWYTAVECTPRSRAKRVTP